MPPFRRSNSSAKKGISGLFGGLMSSNPRSEPRPEPRPEPRRRSTYHATDDEARPDKRARRTRGISNAVPEMDADREARAPLGEQRENKKRLKRLAVPKTHVVRGVGVRKRKKRTYVGKKIGRHDERNEGLHESVRPRGSQTKRQKRGRPIGQNAAAAVDSKRKLLRRKRRQKPVGLPGLTTTHATRRRI